MRKIDYKESIKEAKRLGISVYMYNKKIAHYRISKKEYLECCGKCKMLLSVEFLMNKTVGKKHLRCDIIGVSADESAKIVDNRICDFYKRGQR